MSNAQRDAISHNIGNADAVRKFASYWLSYAETCRQNGDAQGERVARENAEINYRAIARKVAR